MRILLYANPLANIRNTGNIEYVLKAETFGDARSLDEIWRTTNQFGNNYGYASEMRERDTTAAGVVDKK